MPFGIDDALIAIKIISMLKDLIYDKVIEAENSPQLPGGKAKSKSVEIAADRFIDSQEAHPHTKGEMRRLVKPSIDQAVETMNNQGMFVRSRK